MYYVNNLPLGHKHLATQKLSLKQLLRATDYALSLTKKDDKVEAAFVPSHLCSKTVVGTGATYLEAVTFLVTALQATYPLVYVGSSTEEIAKKLDEQG
jgi:hypothetical protein